MDPSLDDVLVFRQHQHQSLFTHDKSGAGRRGRSYSRPALRFAALTHRWTYTYTHTHTRRAAQFLTAPCRTSNGSDAEEFLEVPGGLLFGEAKDLALVAAAAALVV